MLLLAGKLMLERRRAGAGTFALWPYACLAALIGARHPAMAARELMRMSRWRAVARLGLPGVRASAAGG